MLSMDEVVGRSEVAARRQRLALRAGAAAAVLALVAVVAWQVVARTARLEPGSLSVYPGPAVAACAVPDREGRPAAYVVGAEDPDGAVVYSVRNPGVVPVRLVSDDLVRFQREPFDDVAEIQGAVTDDLVASIVVPPGEEAFVQVEHHVSAAHPVITSALDIDATVLGVGRRMSVELDPVLVLVPGTTADPVATETFVREACGGP